MTAAGRRASDLPDMRAFIDFLRDVCRILIECGCSSNRVELLTQLLASSWDFEIDTLATPTGVSICVRKDGVTMVEITRVKTWAVDLDRLSRLNDLVDMIHDRRITLAEANARVQEIAHSQPPYGIFATLLAGGGSSAVLVYGYGGTSLEVALAFPIGVVVQYLTKYVFLGENRRYVGDFVSAALVAAYALGCQWLLPSLDLPRLTVGGIVTLVPGLTFVNAMHEVAQKNLVSGAAKLLEALVIGASLGCGVLFTLGVRGLFT